MAVVVAVLEAAVAAAVVALAVVVVSLGMMLCLQFDFGVF